MKEWMKSLLVAFVIAIIFRSFIYESYKIPSGSMKPTLEIGDYLFVSKFAYGYSRHSLPFSIPIISDRIFFSMPKRGDIIVFKSKQDYSMNYIKRLIGMPGDEIQLKHGIVYLNGNPLPKKESGIYTEVGKFGESKTYRKYTETLPNGVSYEVLDINPTYNYTIAGNTDKYIVPEGHFFFLGDNRNNSGDSRFENMGYIPTENLVGRAEIIFFTKSFSIVDLVTKYDLNRVFTRLSNAN